MNPKPLLHIGTIEFVSLPDDGIQAVPAKIDTGADNSAIWASNIHLQDGKLIFNFFAQGSSYYNQQPIVTSAYRTTTVRNSFGSKEFRYKIQLRVTIGEMTFRRWFSLADRSQNTYPILLGKNFLKNRFVVDVSQKYLVSGAQPSAKIVVLGAQSKASKAFFKQLESINKLPLEYSCIGYDSLLYNIDTPQKTQIINTADDDTDLAGYSYAYFKTHADNSEFALAAAEYLHFRGRPFIDRSVGNHASTSKLSEYMKLSCFGLFVPSTICAKSVLLTERFDMIAEQLGTPFVLKEINSNRGQNNYLVATRAEFKKILREAPTSYTFLAQQYIENDGFYRIYVLGKDAELAIWRDTHKHQDAQKAHLNKPRGGANARLVTLDDLPGEAQDIAIRAAHCMDRQVAGVDLIQDKRSGRWYVLEVNNAPQIRSGSFLPEKAQMIARFFDKELS